MKNNFLRTIAFCLVVFAVSCSKSASDLSVFISKDANAVFEVDPKTISDKIASSGITLDSLANLFSKQDDEAGLKWNDIENSGVDLSKPMFLFSKTTNSVQFGNTNSGGLIANITDAAKLEAFLKKEKADKEILKGEGYSYITLGNDLVAGWTDKVLIISVVSGGNASPGSYNTGQGTLSQLQLTTLFGQKASESIASVDGFKDAISKQGDMHFYINASSALNGKPMPGADKINALIENSYTEGIINFEKGKAVASSEFHANKTLSDILSKYPSKEINTGIIKNYPDTLSGFGIVSFNPKVLTDILHYMGFDMMADGFISNLGFTSNDVVNAFSGDIAFMASPSINDAAPVMPGQQSLHHNNYLASLQIGDKAAFNKVLAGLLSKNIITKNGNYYQLGSEGGHGFIIEVTNDNLLIASGSDMAEAYTASGNKSFLPADIEKEINNKTMAVYVDINTLLKDNNSNAANIHLHDTYYAFANSVQAAKATFKNFITTSDKSDGKTIKGSFELNFINTNENSLASLAKFIAFARKEELANKNDPSKLPTLDSTEDNKNK